MKKLIAFSAALFLLFSASAFAAPPVKEKKPKDKVEVKPKKVLKDKDGRTITPRPNPAATHGKKKGWYKNPHNPHHPASDNPGHAKK